MPLDAVEELLPKPNSDLQMVEADAHLAAIVENSDDAIVGEDLEGIITSWNRGAERTFGYTAEEAVGRSIGMLLPPDTDDDMRGILDIVRRGSAVKHHETTRLR